MTSYNQLEPVSIGLVSVSVRAKKGKKLDWTGLLSTNHMNHNLLTTLMHCNLCLGCFRFCSEQTIGNYFGST